jgi:hypothetical protein
LAMDNLVNGLSEKYGTLFVCQKDAANDNVITSSQVRVATYKGWTVKRYDNGWVKYAGLYESFDIDAINFPDLNFRNYLLAQEYGKGAVLTDDEILEITELDVSKKSISNLMGIKYFWALKYLICNGNSLKSLDVSKNKELMSLNCSNNRLTSLDVSKNAALKGLSCDGNSLKSLDVSKNTVLTKLSCYGNQISGDGMTQLVNSLPTRTTSNYGILLVCADYVSPDNVITAAQVKIATDKCWKVQKYLGNGNAVDYAGLGDVNGDNKIDQNDLDLIVKIIMGQRPAGVGEFAGDLNNDGKTDAADVVVMVNILKVKRR